MAIVIKEGKELSQKNINILKKIKELIDSLLQGEGTNVTKTHIGNGIEIHYVVKLRAADSNNKVSKEDDWEFPRLLDFNQGGAKAVTSSSEDDDFKLL